MEQLNNKKYRASIYLRLSREDGDKIESNSISNQRDLIHNFLENKEDIEVVSERVDDGWSGASFDRPSLKAMLEDAEKGNINCLVFKDLSRFGRNFVEVCRYLDEIFPRQGVRVISINENYDSVNGRSNSDNIMLPFLSLINDSFCRDISIKVRSGLEVKRKKGDYIGSFALYGYFKHPQDKHKLIVDDYAADVIRNIFSLKLEGYSQQSIANKLNETGVLSPMEYKRFCGMNYQTGFGVNNKALWSAVAVGRILKNEFYIGTLVQGKRTTPNHKVKKEYIKPQNEWIKVENNHEAIITLEDFKLVNELLLVDTRIAPKQTAVYTFSGILYCADCGEQLVRNSVCRNGKTYIYYMCGTNRTSKKCTSHRISEENLEDGILSALKQHIANIMKMEDVLKHIDTLPMNKGESKKLTSQISKKKEEIARYESLKLKLFENLSDGILDKKEYLQMKAVYDDKINFANNAIKSLGEELENLAQNDTSNTLWIEKFKQYKNIDGIDRKIAVNLIDKVTVYDDKRLSISFKYQINYNLALSLIKSVTDKKEAV